MGMLLNKKIKKLEFNPLPTESLEWVPINIISKMEIMIML